jgi:hypothetical protein
LARNLFGNTKVSIVEANLGNIEISILLTFLYPNINSVFNLIGYFSNYFFAYYIYRFYREIYQKVNSPLVNLEYENMCDTLSHYIEDIKCNLHGFDKFNYPRIE